MSYMKVSIWFFMVLLMTMSVASVANAIEEEANLQVYVTQPSLRSSYHVGDSVPMEVLVFNDGPSIARGVNINVGIVGTCVIEPKEYIFNLGDMNAGDARDLSFSGIAKKGGDCQLWAYGGEITGGQARSPWFHILKSESVPEFPTVALPAIAIMGMIFLLQRRKGK